MATAAVLECSAPSDRTRMFAGLVQGSKRKAVHCSVQHAEGGFVTSTRHCHASRSPVLVHVTFLEHVAPIRTRDREACRCTRENEHPRKRAPIHTTPAYSDTEAKFSSQTQPRNVHQPRTPNSLHFAHAVHFAHGGQNLLLSFDCRSD